MSFNVILIYIAKLAHKKMPESKILHKICNGAIQSSGASGFKTILCRITMNSTNTT
jgi:tRNA(Ile2) C34 agmatinyltransferase TiaS